MIIDACMQQFSQSLRPSHHANRRLKLDIVGSEMFTTTALTVLRLALLALVAGSSSATGSSEEGSAPILLFEDQFSGTELDNRIWTHRFEGTKRHDGWIVSNAAEVRDGLLRLSVYSEPECRARKHFSAMISTRSSFTRAYGYFEARIRFRTRPGMWSAFWLQSPSINAGPPYEKSGVEIDVMEHRVRDGARRNVSNVIAHALHWGGYKDDHKYKSFRKHAEIGDSFHVYAVEWTSAGYNFFYDGKLTHSVTSSDGVPVSAAAQYIIFSTEVRDENWAGIIPEGGYGRLGESTAYMEVDWVRVYDRKPDATLQD